MGDGPWPRVQRVRFPDASTSWTVVEASGLPARAVEEYLHYLRATASPHTVRAYARALARWWEYLARTTTAWQDVATNDVADWLTLLGARPTAATARIGMPPQGLAPASVQQHAAALMAFYTWQADANGIDGPYQRLTRRGRRRFAKPYQPFLTGIAGKTTPARMFNVRAGNRVRPPLLEPQHVTAILDACAPPRNTPADEATAVSLARVRDRFLFAALWETGARLGEMLAAHHSDWHTGAGATAYIDIVPRTDHPHLMRVKNSKARRIYISATLDAAYCQYVWALVDAGIDIDVPDLGAHHVFVNVSRQPLWAPMRPETVYQRVERVKKTCPQLPREWTPHWLRHTHASTLLLAGCDPHVVMRRLGHANVQTTIDTYGWVTEDAEMQALANWADATTGWQGLTPAVTT